MTAPNIHTKHVAQSISNMVQEWYCGKSDVPHMTVDLFEKRIARFQDDRDSALIAAAFDVAAKIAQDRADYWKETAETARANKNPKESRDWQSMMLAGLFIKDAIRAITPPDAQAALQAMIDAAVKAAREVRPLVWVESDKSPEYLTANTGFGIVYRISAHRGPDNVIWWLGNTARGDNLPDIPAAKAAAQEDYKARKLAKIGGAL